MIRAGADRCPRAERKEQEEVHGGPGGVLYAGPRLTNMRTSSRFGGDAFRRRRRADLVAAGAASTCPLWLRVAGLHPCIAIASRGYAIFL